MGRVARYDRKFIEVFKGSDGWEIGKADAKVNTRAFKSKKEAIMATRSMTNGKANIIVHDAEGVIVSVIKGKDRKNIVKTAPVKHRFKNEVLDIIIAKVLTRSNS